MTATHVLPAAVLVALVTVEGGGWVLLGLRTGKGEITEDAARVFRAGHAHAGVLLILSLVYFLYLDRTRLADAAQWALGVLLLAGVAAQSGGFFLHLAKGAPAAPTTGTTTTRVGAALLAAALLGLAVAVVAAPPA